MKKQFFIFLIIAALLITSAPLSKAETTKKLFADNAKLITESERKEIHAEIKSIGDKYNTDIFIVTELSENITNTENFIANYSENYGRNNTKDFLMLLVVKESEKSYEITTVSNGKTADVFKEPVQEKLVYRLDDFTNVGDFHGMFCFFADFCEQQLNLNSIQKSRLLVDNAGILTPDEYSNTAKKLEEISEKHKIDLVILTEPTINNANEHDYIANFYDTNGFGYGTGKNGFIMMITWDNFGGLWTLMPNGKCKRIMDSEFQEDLQNEFVPYLKARNYYSAFEKYTSMCEAKLESYGEINPYQIAIGFGIGAVISFIVLGAMKAKLKSVKSKPNAAYYVKNSSFRLTSQSDKFLFANVTKVPIPKDNGSSGGSSFGGSHSGGNRGGSSGRF